VQQVNAMTALRVRDFEARHRELVRVLRRFLERRVVADGRALVDAARGRDGSRAREQRFSERGLSRSRLADERDRPYLLDRKFRHGGPPPRVLHAFYPSLLPTCYPPGEARYCGQPPWRVISGAPSHTHGPPSPPSPSVPSSSNSLPMHSPAGSACRMPATPSTGTSHSSRATAFP